MPKSYETIEFKSDVLKSMGPFKIIPKAGPTGATGATASNATQSNSDLNCINPPSYESLYPKLK